MASQQEMNVERTIEQVREALNRDDVAGAIQLLEHLKPPDKLEVFDELDVEDQAELIPRLKPDESAELLVELDDEEQADIAKRVDDRTLSRILDEMEPDDAADVIGDLPQARRESILSGMIEAEDVRPLLIHPDESAGGLMTTSFLTLRPGMTAQDAITALREWHLGDELPYYLFVVDRSQRLVGVVSLRALITSAPSRLIGDFMNPDVITVPVGTDQEECANILRKHGFLALPVVDANYKLLGVITADDLVEVIEEEATEDVYRMGGVPDEERVFSPLRFSLRKRLPWLYINLATAFLAAWVVSLFENTVAQVAILAAVQSIVAGQGGNAATQRVTIIVRALALDEVNLGDMPRVVGKEVLLGALQGIAIALVVGLGIAVWQSNAALGVVVALAMLGNLIVAGLAGAFVPFVLQRAGIDPALASSVIVTTFTDCCGFAFSLGLATLLLPYLV